jgi:hypothetical protein
MSILIDDAHQYYIIEVTKLIKHKEVDNLCGHVQNVKDLSR